MYYCSLGQVIVYTFLKYPLPGLVHFCLHRFSYIFEPTVHDISMLSYQREVYAKSVYCEDGCTLR